MKPHFAPLLVSDLIDNLSLANQEAGNDLLTHDTARVRALDAARKLVTSLEKPEEAIQQFAFLVGPSKVIKSQ
jgi:hypothetical protein